MNAFDLLKADHKKVAELFDQMESASGKAKLSVFNQIKSELELHTHVEETIFYPALEKPEATHDLTLEAYEEHEVVKTLLEELSGSRSADDEWQAQAKVLRENVEHHVDEEENELFDKADDVLSDEEIEALGNRMEAEKARKQGQPAPKPAAKAGKSKAADKPGLLSKIANFVGLGGKATKKKAKKAPAKKAAAKGGSKRGAKTPAKSKARKSSKTSASKRATPARAAKRAPRKRSTTTAKRSAARSRKGTTKKR